MPLPAYQYPWLQGLFDGTGVPAIVVAQPHGKPAETLTIALTIELGEGRGLDTDDEAILEVAGEPAAHLAQLGQALVELGESRVVMGVKVRMGE